MTTVRNVAWPLADSITPGSLPRGVEFMFMVRTIAGVYEHLPDAIAVGPHPSPRTDGRLSSQPELQELWTTELRAFASYAPSGVDVGSRCAPGVGSCS